MPFLSAVTPRPRSRRSRPIPRRGARTIGALVAVACLAAPGGASAAELVTSQQEPLDASNFRDIFGVESGGALVPYTLHGQVFTAEVSGILTRLTLPASQASATAGLRISLLDVDAHGVPVGVPPEDEIAGGTQPADPGGTTSASVAIQDGPHLVAGRRYAIAAGSLTTPTNPWRWLVARSPFEGPGYWSPYASGAWEPQAPMAYTVHVAASHRFGGFLPPLAGDGSSTAVKAGRAVPVKFSLDGLTSATLSSATSRAIPCDLGVPAEILSDETPTDGPRGLTYDPVTDRYSYVWATDPAWKGTCRELVLTLDDGVPRRALFRFLR